jgi:hypothetical protein
MGGGAGYLFPSKEREREGVEGWFEGVTEGLLREGRLKSVF